MTVSRPTTHLCIATGQNLANLIPAVQLGARKVIVIETPAMKVSARNLKRALEARHIEVVREPFDDSSPAAIEASAEDISMRYGETALVFNVTGGHKLMTLALDRNLKLADDLHVLYAESVQQRLDWLSPAPALEPMAQVLGINDILQVQGFARVDSASRSGTWRDSAQQRAALTRLLGDESPRLEGLIGAINAMAQRARPDVAADRPLQPDQELVFAPSGVGAQVLQLARDLGLIAWEDGSTTVRFCSGEATHYLGGQWLEEYVWAKLNGCRPHDCASSLLVESLGTRSPNELDAVAVHGNRMLVIECKTARFGQNEAKDAEYIYKLAQLTRSLGGSQAQGVLVSARKLGEAARARAQENGVRVLSGGEIKTLVPFLQHWMKGPEAAPPRPAPVA